MEKRKQDPLENWAVISILVMIFIFFVGLGVKYIAKSFSEWDAKEARELQLKKKQFTAVYGLPAEPADTEDEKQIRTRVIHQKIYEMATVLSQHKQLEEKARNSIYDGVGKDYANDLVTTKVRRDVVAQLSDSINKEERVMTRAINLAHVFDYERAIIFWNDALTRPAQKEPDVAFWAILTTLVATISSWLWSLGLL